MKNVKSLICLALIVAVLFVQIRQKPLISKVNAGSGLQFLDLDGSDPEGIVYDSARECVWVALHGSAQLARIDVISKDVSYWTMGAWRLALDADGNVWVASGAAYNNVHHFIVENETVIHRSLNISPDTGSFDVKLCGDKIWVLTCGEGNQYLIAFNYTTGEILSTTLICSDVGLGVYGLMEVDNDCIWISQRYQNTVVRYNTTTETIDRNITGISNPYGMCVDENYVYVAEFENMPSTYPPPVAKIATIDKTTLTFEETVVRQALYNGPKSVYKDSEGYLWYCGVLDEGLTYVGVVGGVEYGAYASSGGMNFMTEVSYEALKGGGDPVEIWVSFKASAHIAIKEIDRMMLGNVTFSQVDNNKDGKIDGKDIALVALAFGTVLGDARWNPDADVNADGKIDGKDIALVALSFGESF
jgi:hypothetical protein